MIYITYSLHTIYLVKYLNQKLSFQREKQRQNEEERRRLEQERQTADRQREEQRRLEEQRRTENEKMENERIRQQEMQMEEVSIISLGPKFGYDNIPNRTVENSAKFESKASNSE